VEYLIDLSKVKIVQELIIGMEVQFVLDPLIEVECKIELEVLAGLLVDLIVLIIVQVFHLG
tara:strand:- start:500 stop:682 length:183 start_codon:yes stop_codon:yes gene_type:complete